MKKILSFVLVLSLVLGSFSMAFAATPASTPKAGLSDISGNANEDAIQVAYDLGVVTGNPDGTYLPAKTVSRAEFAAMITRALAVPDSALTAKTSKFKDTNGYGWAVPYLAFCESKGIMLGDGNGNAMPGRTVTVNEAVTMVLRAIGYTANSSELTGTWPSNYVTVAQNSKLYDDVAKNATSVDKGNAAQIIYNALTVQKVSVNSDGKTDKLTITDPSEKTKTIAATLINTGLDCTQKKDHVITSTDYDNAIINVTKYMGVNGTAYYNKDKEIVAFIPEDSTSLTGSFDGDKFKVGTEKYSFASNAQAKSSPTYLVNTEENQAKNIKSTDPLKTQIQAMEAYSDGDVTINVDLSGKTINQVYSIVGWKATDAKKVSTSDLPDFKNKKLLNGNFKENKNTELDTTSFALVGVTALDKIAKDNIVYIYSAADKDKTIRKVAVGTEVVKGKVTEKDKSDTDPYVMVNAKKYERAEFAKMGLDKQRDLPDLDADAILNLDAYGKVYDFDGKGGLSDKYGIIETFVTPAGVDNAKAKIYTSDDSTKTLTLVDWKDMKWTTQSGVNAKKDDTIAGNKDKSPVNTRLVGYDLDKDGLIKAMDTSAFRTTNSSTNLKSTKVLTVVSPGGTKVDLDIDKDVVVFNYEAGKTITTAGLDFDIVKIADVDTNKVIATTDRAIEYILNKDGDVVALFVSADFTDSTNDNIYAVLNSVTEGKDGGDDVEKLTGLSAGKEGYTAVTDKLLIGKNYSVDPSNIGLWILKPNGSGKIKEATLFNKVGFLPGDTKHDQEECIVSGSGNIRVEKKSDDDVFTLTNGGGKFSPESNAIVYKVVMRSDNTKVDKYEVAKISDIRKDAAVWAYDTRTGKDHKGVANIVIFREDFTTTPSNPSSTTTSLAYVNNGTVKVTLPTGAVESEYAVTIVGKATNQINGGYSSFTGLDAGTVYTANLVKLADLTKVITTINFIEKKPALSSIAITTPASKLTYKVGETLSIAGLVVTGTYDDTTTKPETIAVGNVSGFNSAATVASQTLTITVGSKTTTYNIAIIKADGPAAPTGVGKTDTTGGLANGTLTGVASGQEYQVNGTGAWTPITATPVTALAAGTYTVRVAATATQEAGAVTTVVIL